MSTEKVVLGRYRVLERVGRGAMGVIYRGLDPVLDREVAIKVMSADFAAEGEDSRKRFFREARAAAKLQHRNIVTVFEFAEEDSVPYIVMEFLRGSNLASRIMAEPPLPLERKLEIMAELCDGLQYASENGIIHRDVKPANVWLLEDGSVKLVDFGIAKITTATSTLGKDVIGSAAYMSPEQAEGRPVDARTDIFSAAVVLYELVAGRRPFEASTPTATLLKIVQEPPPPIAEFVPDVPALLVAIIERALEKNPANRHQSASEFGADLRFVRATLMANSETGLASDPALGSSTTRTAVSATASARTTATGRSTGASHPRWGRLILAGVIGGLVMSGVLYWSQVGWPARNEPVPTTGPGGAPVDPGRGGQGGKTPEVNGTPTSTPGSGQAQPAAGIPATPSPKPGPRVLRLHASADYEFAVRNDKGETLSPRQSIHAEVVVPDSAKQVWLYAADRLLNYPVPVDRDRLTFRVPKLGTLIFLGRPDCRPINPLREIAEMARIEVVEGQHTFDFQCDREPPVERRAVTVRAGTDAKVDVK